MPTLEDILGLPPEGYLKIKQMSAEELKEYLKDICVLEPDNVVEDAPEVEDKIKKLSGAVKKKVSKKKQLDDDFMKVLGELDKLTPEETKKIVEGF